MASAAAAANPAVSAGQQLFAGQQPLVAHMQGHTQALPRDAARCINCHTAPGVRAENQRSFGPRLDSAQLLKLQARRGGPPSRYDTAALCRALREGIDPAGVVLPTAMPRYRIDDAGCRTLWAYLTSELQ